MRDKCRSSNQNCSSYCTYDTSCTCVCWSCWERVQIVRHKCRSSNQKYSSCCTYDTSCTSMFWSCWETVQNMKDKCRSSNQTTAVAAPMTSAVLVCIGHVERRCKTWGTSVDLVTKLQQLLHLSPAVLGCVGHVERRCKSWCTSVDLLTKIVSPFFLLYHSVTYHT